MRCSECGAELDPNAKFCPSCGKKVVENQTMAAPTSSQQSTDSHTGGMSYNSANVGSNPNYNSGGTPYGNFSGMPGDGAIPPKKKKFPLWLKILLIVIPIFVVLVIAVIVIIFLVARAMTKEAASLTDQYWKAFVSCDGKAIIEMMPEEATAKICAENAVTETQLCDAMTTYLEDVHAKMGGRLHCEWEMESYRYTSDFNSVSSVATTYAKEYGFDFQEYMEYWIDVEISGLRAERDNKVEMLFVKSDGTWYCLNVLDDVEQMLRSDQLQNTVYQQQFQEPLESYINAVLHKDAAVMQKMAPASWFQYMQDNYGCSVPEANECMKQQLMDIYLYEMDFDKDDLSGDCSNLQITDIVPYEESEVNEINDSLGDYGLEGEEMADVTISFDMNDASCDSYIVTMTRIGDTWYVYDVMYQYSNAVYYYYDPYNYDDGYTSGNSHGYGHESNIFTDYLEGLEEYHSGNYVQS